MPRLGITGHSNLAATSIPIVAEAIKDVLTAGIVADLVGVSCLARGADQIFAQAVLDLGGTIEVVLPAADYRERKVKPDNAATFDTLLRQAATVHIMPFANSNRAAYMAASEHVLSTVDGLIAVWDGEPSGGHGGTADVVRAARERDIPVTIIWPHGTTRE